MMRWLQGTLLLCTWMMSACAAATTEDVWLQPGDGRELWGHRDGLVFTIWPGALYDAQNGGPRGLIRMGFMHEGTPQMINFIAIEPIVGGNRGFSELEPSELDGVPGKRLWCFSPDEVSALSPGEPRPQTGRSLIRRGEDGSEQLEVGIGVERFANGAEVYLQLRMDSRRPHELELRTHAIAGSAPIERCILTATMGNFIRARRLWLADHVVESTQIFADYKQNHFTEHATFEREKLLNKEGSLWAAITTDEADPASVWPFDPPTAWHYPGPPMTQYWRAPDDHPAEPCQIRVNGRYTYWQSDRPVPGGVSYENFEFDRPFHEGQTFVFGVTREEPGLLGFAALEEEETKPAVAKDTK